jgi:hypothetical protein
MEQQATIKSSIPTYYEFRRTLRAIHALIYNPVPKYNQADKKIAALTSRFEIDEEYYSTILYRYVYIYAFATEPTDGERIHPDYHKPVFTSIHAFYDYMIFLSDREVS